MHFILILVRLHILHILDHHKGDPEGDGVLKYAKVEACGLFQLIQTVYQSIPVDIELSGGLGHVQIVLKELIDGGESLIIKLVGIASVKDLLDEHLAKRYGKLIDESAYAEGAVGYDLALLKEYLAHVKRHPGFLI